MLHVVAACHCCSAYYCLQPAAAVSWRVQVRYVIALLRDLLVALDVAQRVLGFAHYDLK